MRLQIRSEVQRIRELLRQGGQRLSNLGQALQSLDKKVLPALMAVTQLTNVQPPNVTDAEVMAQLQNGPPPQEMVVRNLDKLTRLTDQLQRDLASASDGGSTANLNRRAADVYRTLISVHAASQLAASQPAPLQVSGPAPTTANPWKERERYAIQIGRTAQQALNKSQAVIAYTEQAGKISAAVTSLNEISETMDWYFVNSWVVYTNSEWNQGGESPAAILARLGTSGSTADTLRRGFARLRTVVTETQRLLQQGLPFDLDDRSVSQVPKDRYRVLVKEGLGLTQALRIVALRAGDTSSLDGRMPTTSAAEGYESYASGGQPFVKGRGDKRAMHWNDIQQGELGTCYMLAALRGLLLDRPALADQIFLERMPGDQYKLRINQRMGNGKWTERQPVVSPTFPVHTTPSGSTAPAYTKLGDGSVLDGKTVREYWPGLVELAVSKAHGGFHSVVGGSTSDGFRMLSNPTDVKMYQTARHSASEIKRLLREAKRNKFPIVAGTDGFNEELGLIGPHAYTVQRVGYRIQLLGTRPGEEVSLTPEEFKRGFADFSIAIY